MNDSSTPEDPNPSGICECGCGLRTRVEKNGKRRGCHSMYLPHHAQHPYRPTPPGAALISELEEEARRCHEIYLHVVGRRLYHRNRFYRPRMAVWERDAGTCVCGAPGAEVHHIRPLHLGGDNHLTNLITLCWSCHREAHQHIRQTA